MAFLEEYTLLDELGQGGYATVYKVRHNNLGYIRAIRVLNAIIAHGETDKTYQKFLEGVGNVCTSPACGGRGTAATAVVEGASKIPSQPKLKGDLI